MSNAPEIVYLFVDEDGDLLGYSKPRDDLIPYRRADLVDAELERLRDEKNSYIEHIGDVLGQDYDGETLLDAAERVLRELEKAQALCLEQDRMLAMSAEREAKLKSQLDQLIAASTAVIARWDSPLWRDIEPTAHVIAALRSAVDKMRG